MKNDTVVNLRLPSELKAKVEKAAKKSGETFSEYLRDAVESRLDEGKKRGEVKK